jgi:ubiquitin-like 1-activating enzyme E1 A
LFDLGEGHTYRPEKGKKLLDAEVLEPHVSLETALLKVPLEDSVNRFHKKPPAQWIQYRCLLEYAEQTGEWPGAADTDKLVGIVTKWIEENSPSLKDHKLLSTLALQDLARVATCEVAPVCSVLGGLLGNEIIKAISSKGTPANNTLLFDGVSCKAWTFLVQPAWVSIRK